MSDTIGPLVRASRRPGPRLVLCLATTAVGALVALLITEYSAFALGLAAVYGMLVLAVSLLAGWAGVWSFGHPALLAVGAYAAAFGSTHGWPLELTLLAAVGLAAGAGALLGFVGARFSHLYVALLTLAFGLVVVEVVNRWTSVTGGDEGALVGDLVSVTGLELPAAGRGAVVGAVIAFGVCLALAVAARSSALRTRMVAAKSHPVVARTVGIAPEAQSALAFAASGAVTGLAGVFFALLSGFVGAESFGLHLSVLLLAATVLGGVGSIAGCVVGAAFIAVLPSVAAGVSVSQPILQGAVLVVMLIFLPAGVVPALGWLLARRVPRGPMAPVADEAVTPATEPARQPGETLLEVSGLGVRFGGLTAVRNVELRVAAGEVLGIVGPNGAGKTTLLNALSGVVGMGRLTGSAQLAGHSLLRVRATRRRVLGLGRTFQHAETFDELTVRENLLCTDRTARAHARAEADRALVAVGLVGRGEDAPAELSFGERKRLDLARALTEHPRVLLLDEPFGGLDVEERAVMAAQIRRLAAAGTAVVVIDHVLDELFGVADRLAAFDFGVPLASGPAEEVMADERVRAAYLGTAAEAVDRRPPVGTEPALELRGISHRYEGVSALRDVGLTLARGEIVAVAGANGAGKSTLARIVHGDLVPGSGVRKAHSGTVRSALVPEGRGLFGTLSLRENLEVAGYGAGVTGAALRRRSAEVVARLPERLRTRLDASAAALSGGEQQMLAIGRALMADPGLLVVDEPALGLAPRLVDEVYAWIRELADTGVAVLVLEQSLHRAMQVADRVVVLRDGRVRAEGSPADPGFAATAEPAYFGTGGTAQQMGEEMGRSTIPEVGRRS
ncbi:ATP-binding cassette domain-containing protein [Pseudonocardia halophobica]|uniref:branched-chain amino acid ABC transporter ATP-binding protein/permease n=1 Tax=Pseudonocardia halophobica TaxID=29401 RepID=UPI003D946AD0